MSGKLVHSACIEAVRKNSDKLATLLSRGVIDLIEFGRELVSAKFMETSGLNNTLDSSLKISEKAHMLSQMVTTQVQQDPEKYFKAYLAILETYPSLSSVLEAIRTHYESKSTPLPAAEDNTRTELGESHSPTKHSKTCEVFSSSVDKSTEQQPLKTGHANSKSYTESAFPSEVNTTTELGETNSPTQMGEVTTHDATSKTPHTSTELEASHLQTEQIQSEASASKTPHTSTEMEVGCLQTEQAKKKGFACPCGKCSLRHFLDGNCPEKGSGFPCLNKSILSRSEERILIKRLTDESEDIKIKFAKLEMSSMMWLKSKSTYTPEQLKYVLKPFNSILKDASDFDSIFHILINSNVWSWYSFGYLEKIIRVCSKDDYELFHKFNKYNEEFKAFCERSVFECPNLIANYEPSYQAPLFVKLADEEFNNPSLSDLKKKFETTLATIIEVEPRQLILLTYQDGCIQLFYSLPRAVGKKAFPLSQEQKEMLLKMGVLECYLFPDDPVDENPKQKTSATTAKLNSNGLQNMPGSVLHGYSSRSVPSGYSSGSVSCGCSSGCVTSGYSAGSVSSGYSAGSVSSG